MACDWRSNAYAAPREFGGARTSAAGTRPCQRGATMAKGQRAIMVVLVAGVLVVVVVVVMVIMSMVIIKNRNDENSWGWWWCWRCWWPGPRSPP